MSFAPVLPLGGFAGWRFLQHTQAAQQSAFANSPQIARETAYFRANIGKIASAEDLVADRILFKVALGAFGLDDEISKRYFLQKVLAAGTDDPAAFANRLVDPKYRNFARAFGFGNSGGPRTGDPGFAQAIVASYKTRQFERAVGESDNDLRLALTFRREIGAYANSASADGATWFQIMGNPPLRKVIEAALALPPAMGALNIDRQRQMFREKSASLFGTSSLSALKDPANVDEVIRRFLVRRAAENGPSASTPGVAAISILRAGSAAMSNLIRSGF